MYQYLLFLTTSHIFVFYRGGLESLRVSDSARFDSALAQALDAVDTIAQAAILEEFLGQLENLL